MTETPRAQLRITDPERIRALAHPIRLRLLDLLTDRDEATATECAEAIGESPASCSFHLRTLEKYGFVERGVARGREKPWRAVATGIDMRPDPTSPESVRAVQEIASMGLEGEWLRIHDYFARMESEDDVWVQASTFTRSTFWATADELAELSRDLQSITNRFAGRSADPSLRPLGARHARMMAVANPDPRDSPDDAETGDAGAAPRVQQVD